MHTHTHTHTYTHSHIHTQLIIIHACEVYFLEITTYRKS